MENLRKVWAAIVKKWEVSRLEITWSYDSYECDTCGWNFDTGALVKLDGKVILNKPAKASCLGGHANVDEEGIYKLVLEKLGVEIKELS